MEEKGKRGKHESPMVIAQAGPAHHEGSSLRSFPSNSVKSSPLHGFFWFAKRETAASLLLYLLYYYVFYKANKTTHPVGMLTFYYQNYPPKK